MKSIIEQPTGRHFGGKLSGFTDKKEKNGENKHLKAYLNGDEKFISGYEKIGSVTAPTWSKVKVIWD